MRFGYHNDLRIASIRAIGFDPAAVGDRVLHGATGNPDTLIRDGRNEVGEKVRHMNLPHSL